MKIGETDLTDRDTPYLIAEIGVNHFDIAEQRGLSPLRAAKLMIDRAAEAGADAVKFQSYTAETLVAQDAPAYWDTTEEEATNQYELFTQYDEFGKTEFDTLATWTTENHDLHFLSTPFDDHAVNYLDELVPAYKVASADITNHPLLRSIAGQGKPILLSTGASTVAEIDDAVRVIHNENSKIPVCLLHCVLQYPTDETNANLAMIEHLDAAFSDSPVGYSDHVRPDESMITLLNATIRGASVIEKHFTLDKSLEGNDHYHAMNPGDIRRFRANVARLHRTTGQYRKAPIEAEADSRQFARRSLVAATRIQESEPITRDRISIKRPGTGISPSMLDVVVGRTATRTIEPDEVISWELL